MNDETKYYKSPYNTSQPILAIIFFGIHLYDPIINCYKYFKNNPYNLLWFLIPIVIFAKVFYEFYNPKKKKIK